ncbi:hypothetical protein EW026_g2301 [Hermanssonia centrifuga]|uniref:Uncharacterized protein n=1 Tax=Hermanssonia centrifuga TaxID=98765 RepID=A0A4S4KPN6_9APHY|nr:hypothetical protein EW026_g2301 [Hermanssonia centrifuga]
MHASHAMQRRIFGYDYAEDALLDPLEGVNDCVRIAEWDILNGGHPHFPHHDLDSLLGAAQIAPPDHHHESFTHAARTSLELPLSSDLLYILSRGVLSHGVIQINDHGDSDSDVAVVGVTFLYNSPSVLDVAKVCALGHGEGKHGVGIFTPMHRSHPKHEHRTRFVVDVTLPSSSSSSPLVIKRFETDMPIFTHYIHDLENTVDFHSLKLRTSNGPIVARSVFAQEGFIQTSNGPIVGNFSSSDSLVLRTSNGVIHANVTLSSGDSHQETKLDLKTSNSPITSNITLVSTTEDGTGGAFKVNTKTSNGPLVIGYPSAPIDSHLDFEARSSNSPVRATLHETYEGDFFLRSSAWFPTSVEHDDSIEDPAGKDRKRQVDIHKVSRGVIEGSVKWVPSEEKQAGTVRISTSNSPVQLTL